MAVQVGLGNRETIFALSSGAPPAGVAVIRMSGPRTRIALETVAGALPRPRAATLRSIRSRNDRVIDNGLILFFETPHSFTGEDCAEFQVHGGRAVISALLDTLSGIDGCRHAEPGEFARRAFECGRLDLTSAEALGDLIAAQTEMQRRMALEQARGGLTVLYDEWAGRLNECRAMIEAELDFSDETDVRDHAACNTDTVLWDLRDSLKDHLDQSRAAEIVHDGYQIVIAGPPNSGKSSLMNLLARRDVSIVSDEPGTTRDVMSVTLDLGGYAAVIRDTAGIHEASGEIEREGIRRALAAADDADLVLLLSDLSSKGFGKIPVGFSSTANFLKLGTKADLLTGDMIQFGGSHVDMVISSASGAGIDDLLDEIRHRIEQATRRSSDALPARMRHRQYLESALVHIEAVLHDPSLALEFRAEELRAAAFALGRITGRVDVDDLLDVIFSTFCVGK